jgi:hypothetical protein
MALFRITNPGAPGIRQRGVTPLMYQYGETLTKTLREVARGSDKLSLNSSKEPSLSGPWKLCRL